MISKIVNNKNLVIIYSGSYEYQDFKLNYKPDSTASKNVEMSVIINEISPNKMKGIRSITVDNKCTAKFSVELTRPSK